MCKLPVVAPPVAVSVAAIVVIIVSTVILALPGLHCEIAGDYSVTPPVGSLGPHDVRCDAMVLREEVNVDGIDHLDVARRVLLPIAVRLAIRRTTAEVVNVRIKAEVERDIRPAQAAPPKIDHHGRRDAGALRHVEHDGNFFGRESLLLYALLYDDDLTLGNLVIVSYGKVKAPEAIA
jgi:hypothetical protein